MGTTRNEIVETIISKSNLKQRVFDKTTASFNLLKETLLEMASELDDELEGKLDRRVRLEYRDRGKFEAQLQIAGDMLLFQMRTDVFFHEKHSYSGMINIYNFLSDSFKFNRNADEGYLIGRIFIDNEGKFLLEGAITDEEILFEDNQISRTTLVAIMEAAIIYAINFDLLAPSFEDNRRVKLDQFNSKMDNSKFETGKRLNMEM
ncbi:MAG: hypothetical protein SNH88_05385 [Rikenellaceae bacterium]